MRRPTGDGVQGVFGRAAANIGSIRRRAVGVRARTVRPWAGMSRSEVLVALGVAALLIFICSIALDAISVPRARAVPGYIVAPFAFISDAGKSQWELYPAGIVVLVLLFGRWSIVPRFVRVFWAEVGALSAYIFLSIGGAGLIVNIVKQPIGRGRPPTFDEFGAVTLQPFHFDYLFQSFPSGHSTTGGALIAIGFLVFPRWRIALLAFGLAIGASRVVVQAHYPSDVLAGLLFGFFFSYWLAGRFAAAGWAFARGPAGTIRARVAAIRLVGGSRARIAVVLAGLADALVGRAAWVPALASIGDGFHDASPVRTDRSGEA